jgi:RNA polymerase sigma-70 factor (ECF subfamily)
VFDREYIARIPAYLAKHSARTNADEIRQQMRERLLVARPDAPARIGGYEGRGSLASWVKVATLRAASNVRRAEQPEVELADEIPAAAITEVPELRVMAGEYRSAFRAAFRAAFAALPAEERTVLRLHFLDGVTVRQLAPMLNVSSATAGRRLLSAQTKLGELVLAELAVAVAVPRADLESAVRAIVSRLDVSLSAMQI